MKIPIFRQRRLMPRSSHWRCSAIKSIGNISQTSQENTYVGVTCVKFAKFLRKSLLKNICKQLLLNVPMPIHDTHIWPLIFSNFSLTSDLDPNSKIMIIFVVILILYVDTEIRAPILILNAEFVTKGLFKKRLRHSCFPVKFVKFQKHLFTEHLWSTVSIPISYRKIYSCLRIIFTVKSWHLQFNKKMNKLHFSLINV